MPDMILIHDTQKVIKTLERFGLNRKHIYLLELIPLIDVMWSDGKNQRLEINLIYQYTVEHLAHLYNKFKIDRDVLSIEECNEFLERFCYRERPSPELLNELCLLAQYDYFSLNNGNKKFIQCNRQKIIEFCFDIAAVSVDGGEPEQCKCPAAEKKRIVEEERKKLKELSAIFLDNP